MAKVYAKDPLTGEFVPVGQYNVQPYNDADVKEKIQGNTNRIQTLETDKVGKLNERNGVILNDSSNEASGQNSLSIGIDCKARSICDFAGGYQSEASGGETIAFGDGVKAQFKGSAAFGRYNNCEAKPTFSIGIGAGFDNAENAIEVSKEGFTFIKGVGGYDGTNSVTPNTKGIIGTDLAKFLNDGGAARKLLENAGAYQKSNGNWMLNGIEMSYAEVVKCYSHPRATFTHKKDEANEICFLPITTEIITNFPSPCGFVIGNIIYSSATFPSLAIACRSLRKIKLFDSSNAIRVKSFPSGSIATQCENFEEISDVIEISDIIKPFGIYLTGCPKFKTIYLKGLNSDIDLSEIPALSVDDTNSSLKFLIENSSSKLKDSVTITLHHDAYVKVSQNLINAALAKHITIADATPAQA